MSPLFEPLATNGGPLDTLPLLRLEQAGAVLHIRLNRPAKRNQYCAVPNKCNEGFPPQAHLPAAIALLVRLRNDGIKLAIPTRQQCRLARLHLRFEKLP